MRQQPWPDESESKSGATGQAADVHRTEPLTSWLHPGYWRSPELELQVGERPHADARQQDLVLVVRHRIADVLVQQIVADHAHHHFAGAEPARIEFRLVADFRLQQIIA